jgi:2,3,4,5-tetrahydropyridine-2,6-dicarboxylate N-succinyltransferase (EC 2.3.1.117)
VMSQAYVNIGVYLGDGSMVDSNVTVGSCAQIGKKCHIGANTLIGGVLEPIEDKPVVIEDNVSIGGGSKVTSGFEIRENVEVAENTLLTPRIDIYDLKKNEIIRGRVPSDRRVFQRYVESSVSNHEMFEDKDANAQKPVAVAVSKERDKAEIEEELRMK